MLTGHETTATTTAAALYCISAHPAVEQQLLAELQGVLGDRPPTYADLEHLPYLQVGENSPREHKCTFARVYTHIESVLGPIYAT